MRACVFAIQVITCTSQLQVLKGFPNLSFKLSISLFQIDKNENKKTEGSGARLEN